jgi:hypothetical protein
MKKSNASASLETKIVDTKSCEGSHHPITRLTLGLVEFDPIYTIECGRCEFAFKATPPRSIDSPVVVCPACHTRNRISRYDTLL